MPAARTLAPLPPVTICTLSYSFQPDYSYSIGRVDTSFPKPPASLKAAAVPPKDEFRPHGSPNAPGAARGLYRPNCLPQLNGKKLGV